MARGLILTLLVALSSACASSPSSPDNPDASASLARETPRALDNRADISGAVERHLEARTQLTKRIDKHLDKLSSPFTFRVASFNVLGDSHTGPGGNKPNFPDGSARMNMAIGALRSHDVDVVGFQEFESSQHAMFAARAGEYDTYPGTSLGTKSVRFNIAWRTSVWTLVEAHTLPIPYAGGSRIDMPVILLESRETGRRAWFANFHNPADTPSLGNNGHWRAMAAQMEVDHLTELHESTNYPVLSTGDYNEREAIFCLFTGGGSFTAAAGGSSGGTCIPPSRMEVDWIFGSTGVDFADYAANDVGRASDHRMITATATLLPPPSATKKAKPR